MKSEIMNLMTKKVADDLHGPRGTQHIRCAFGPFVAPSRVPICLDTEKVDSPPPPTAAGVDGFSPDSIGHFRPCSVFNPARVLLVVATAGVLIRAIGARSILPRYKDGFPKRD